MKFKQFKPKEFACKECGDVISSTYSGEFVTCNCGSSFVDQTNHYTRIGGNAVPREDYEEVMRGKESER